MPRTLMVFGEKNFNLTLPDGARVTFAPWAPPRKDQMRETGWANGTLRVYEGAGEKNCLGVFSPVYGFRDLNLGYDDNVPQRIEPVRPGGGGVMRGNWDLAEAAPQAWPMEVGPLDDFNR